MSVTSQRILRATACVALLMCGTVHAGLYPAYPTGTGLGVWEVDRFPPSGFVNAGTQSGRANVLALTLSSSDSAANRPPAYSSTFYNTQGRGIQEDLAAYSVIYGSVYLPAAWASTNPGDAALNRRTEMWGVLSPATGGDTCASSACNLFPIIGFTNASAGSPLTAGGMPRLRVFDSNIGFVDVGAPAAYDAWTDVCIAFSGSQLSFYVNAALVYTQSNLVQDDTSFGPPVKWSRTIMQAYNFGTGYTSNWSGLGAGRLAAASGATGSGQSAQVGMPFATPLKVVATDAGGAPLPCVPVTFAAPAFGASATLSASMVLTNTRGEATVAATANAVAGSYAVTATAPGVAPVKFALTNTGFPPALTKSFSPLTVKSQEFSTLTITIGNATGASYALTAPFVDAMPSGLLIPTAPTGTCGGVTATQSAITMAAGTAVPAGGCTIVVNVSAPAPGTYTNTTSTLATSAGDALPATAVLTVTLALPGLIKEFLPPSIPAGDTGTLSIRILSDNSGPPGTLVLTQPFVDTMPAGVTIEGGNKGTCPGVSVSGNALALPAGTSIGLGGCTIVVDVTALAGGTYANTTSALVTNAGTTAPVSATLVVTGNAVLTAMGGGDQQATINTAYGEPLRAALAGASGNPIAGVAVTFTLPLGGASGTFAGGGTSVTVVTGAAGVATSPIVTANGIVGSFTATAAAAGLTTSAHFSMTNVASAAATTSVPALGPLGLVALVVGVVLLARRRRGTVR
ncbi:MAG TPA: hypothetical protein VMN56_07815 [Casimicrobiaceae bacterium]|nr:hypothetical protein [Casimicrobiaceae bacterium]